MPLPPRGRDRPLVSGAEQCIICGNPPPFQFVYKLPGYSFTMVRCSGCGLVFQDPQPDDAVLNASYYQDPEFSRQLSGPLREITLQRARDKLALVRELGVARPGARVLDVGCSSGAWLEVAANEGMTPTGIEIGETTAQDARDRGLDVRTGTLEQSLAGLAGERFDLVTFWDVLEHLRDPRRELSLAADLLAPGGVVAATFPNVDGLYPRLTYRVMARRTGRWEYPELPVHLYDFAPDTARRLLELMGFEVAGCKTFETPFQFYRETTLAVRHLGGGPRAVALRLGFEALKLVAYPLARLREQGNAMFIAAGATRKAA